MCSPALWRTSRSHDRRHRNALRSLMTPALALALTACGADEGPAPAMVVEDSAGVRIVRHTGTPSVPALTLADQPVYTHGTRPGDYVFANIDEWMGGVLYANGDAAIHDSGNDEIVLLSDDGTRHELLARAGDGPGEIGRWSVNLHAGRADTLLVEDRDHRRLILFADDSVVRGAIMPNVAVQPDAHGLDASGRVLMSAGSPSAGDFAGPWRPGYMVRLDLETRRLDSVASFDWRRPPPGRRDGTALFSYAGVVGAAGGEFVHGRNDIAELVWRRPDGVVRQIMRWEPEWVHPTEESRDRFLACRGAALRADPDRPEAQIAADLAHWRFDFDAPEPLFATILGDDEGRVWLWHWQALCYNDVRYTVIGPDGTWLGAFEPPEDFTLLHVAGGRVLGVVKDELDRESVAVYELVNTG